MDEIYEREVKLSNATSGKLVTFIMSRQTNQIIDKCKVLDEEMKQLRKTVLEAMSQE